MTDDEKKTQESIDWLNKHAPTPQWKDAVTERCVVDCIGWIDDDPGKSIDRLIWTEIMMHIDPAIAEPVRLSPNQMVFLIQMMQGSAERARKDEMPLSYQEYENFAQAAIKFALQNMVDKIQHQLSKTL